MDRMREQKAQRRGCGDTGRLFERPNRSSDSPNHTHNGYDSHARQLTAIITAGNHS